MAPQRETTGFAASESTFYGALELKSDQSASSGRIKYVAGLAFVAVAMTAAALAFAPTAQTSVDGVVNKAEKLYGPGGEGDDLRMADMPDCACAADSVCTPLDGLGYGYCTAAEADCAGYGFDYNNNADAETLLAAAGVTLDASTNYVRCEIVQGAYDCYAFPCLNGGFCIDGLDDFTCDCKWGFEGDTCETEINMCTGTPPADGGTVDMCDPLATCVDNIWTRDERLLDSERAFDCTCPSGFVGDGYAYTQDATLKWGSVLKDGSTDYGWLSRTQGSTVTTTNDKNNDGQIDVYGCTDINDCASNPCFNGGRCIDLWDGAYNDGTGRLTLEDKALSQANAFECDCTVTLPAERWAGTLCEEDIDECSSGQHNCDNADRADCTNNEGSFSCQCKEFWQGDGYSPDTSPTDWASSATSYDGCIDVDDCSIRTTVPDAGATTTTTTISSPCQNGGTCSNDGEGTGEYQCFCVVGWRGKNCEVDINECEEFAEEQLSCDSNAYCSNTPGSWQCLCNNGWTGNGEIDGGCYDADDCEFSPCQHGGTCADCGTLCYICDCIVGWRGKSCETDWNECVMGIHTCHEFAMCINVPGSFECECEPGYSGDGYQMCNEVNDCNYYSDDAAVDDAGLTDYGQKVYDTNGDVDTANSSGEVSGATWLDDYPIACGTDGWTCYDGNADAASPVTLTNVPVHQCGEFDGARKVFQQHGNCEDVGPAAFICTCAAGWSDSNCDLDIDECARATDTCHKYATCTNTDGSFTCACNLGFSGDGVGTCHDIDDCSVGDSTCDKGFCTDLGVGDFRCTCDAGWTDRLCDQDINECSAMTHTCYVNNEQCFATEQCSNGFKKDEDTGKVVYGLKEWADPCKVNAAGEKVYEPCDTKPKLCKVLQFLDDAKTVPKFCKYDYKNAQCTNTDGSFKCACRDGFVGNGIGADGCTDVDECGSAPCENGECSDDGPLAYACTCDEGWTDTNCDADVNECLIGAHDCHADGKCVNVPGAYYCRCVSGYTGDGYTCTDLDDCDPDPCDPEHGICSDQGANRYGCTCTNGPGWDVDVQGPYGGFAPPDCSTPTNECLDGTHVCDPNADCMDVYGSYMCTCKDGFYGDGLECAPCTECPQYCPDEEGVAGAECGSENWLRVGWHEDEGMPPCDRVDRTCVNDIECADGTHNCDVNAACADTQGSFTCTCEGEWWGIGHAEGECDACTVCGLGEYMKADCTSTDDRECRVTIPDGNYAMQTDSGSVSQCLVHWKEPGQIYPERYSWGGRSTTQTEGADEFGAAAATQTYGSNWVASKEAAKPAPDYCVNPVCGVCDWDDQDPKDNLVKGMETVWTFKRLEDDLYLILNGADGNGFRCFGFQTPEAPYPTMVVWQDTSMQSATGVCTTAGTNGGVCSTDGDCRPVELTASAAVDVAVGDVLELSVTTAGTGTVRDVTSVSRGVASVASTGTTITVTMETGTFGAGAYTLNGATAVTVTAAAVASATASDECTKDDILVGEWVTDLKGVEYDDIERCEYNRAGLPTQCALTYMCGMENNANGSARAKLMANGGTVWNVQQLGCTKDPERRWLCERNPVYENKFMIRSLAGQDANRDNSVTKLDYECLFFPQIAGGQYTHPRRAPRAPSNDGVWGGLSADADGNGDNECGILTTEGETQEQALVSNKQATWTLIPLPDY